MGRIRQFTSQSVFFSFPSLHVDRLMAYSGKMKERTSIVSNKLSEVTMISSFSLPRRCKAFIKKVDEIIGFLKSPQIK